MRALYIVAAVGYNTYQACHTVKVVARRAWKPRPVTVAHIGQYTGIMAHIVALNYRIDAAFNRFVDNILFHKVW